MKIDNLSILENEFLKFDEDSNTFYKFTVLLRGKDHSEHPILSGRRSDTEFIKSWTISTEEEYEKYKPRMTGLCDMLGARLYLGIEKKDTLKTTFYMLHKLLTYTEIIKTNSSVRMRNICKVMDSASSTSETTAANSKVYMIDIDTKDSAVLTEVCRVLSNIKASNQVILPTLNGFHVLVKLRENTYKELVGRYSGSTIIDITGNSMCLAYMPEVGE